MVKGIALRHGSAFTGYNRLTPRPCADASGTPAVVEHVQVGVVEGLELAQLCDPLQRRGRMEEQSRAVRARDV